MITNLYLGDSKTKTPYRFFIFWLLLIAGFQINANSAKAGFVAPADRLSIDQPQFSGQWKGPYVTVQYKYIRGQGNIDLSGAVTFAYTMVMGYTLLDNFRIGAIFLDKNGRVLKETGLATDRDSFEAIHFDKVINLPFNAVFMAFDYQGEAGGSHSGPTSFWFYPIN